LELKLFKTLDIY